jgi:DNA-binding NtrC family response regulator
VQAERQSSVSPTFPDISPPAPPTAIVFEKRPRWAPELERQFLAEEVRVVACRAVKDVEERSAGVSRGVVLLDASVATPECLQYLRHAISDPQALPVIVVGNRQTAPLEWSFRELGAAAFFAKKIPGHEMASLCRRQWTRRGRRSVARPHRPALSH